MSGYELHDNAVSKDAARIVHLNVLKSVSEIVMRTAGPKGSTTMITRQNAYPIFSKDGKKVAESIAILGEVERGILDQLLQIVQQVVAKVGDGTTSAIRLAYLIYKELVERESELGTNPYDIIEDLQTSVDAIIEEIKKNTIEFTPEKVEDICMISTNGNTKLSKTIADIYKKYGAGVYIDLKSANVADIITKEYDGLTLNKGYSSPAFINRPNDVCELRNARIYIFKDPVDTPEMIGFFTKILYDNIITPFQNLQTLNKLQNNPAYARNMTEDKINEIAGNTEFIPTLIMCPFLSRDMSTTMQSLETILYSFDKDQALREQKPPVAVVTDLSRNIDELFDISTLAGCKVIGKYIDESVQKADIAAGKAPTVDTVSEFYGMAEQVLIDKEKTKFINPIEMFEKDEDGNFKLDGDGNRIYSSTYTALVSFLKGQLEECNRLQESAVEINRLKRRLNGLTSALVELYIGGIGATDRDSVKDLADDAIRNCRSAAANGIGRGCNFEGLMASRKLRYSGDKTITKYAEIINDAYYEVVLDLYNTVYSKQDARDELAYSMDTKKEPVNLRSKNYDKNVYTSINTDPTILDCVTRIISVLFTSNQILVSSPVSNTYKEIANQEE